MSESPTLLAPPEPVDRQALRRQIASVVNHELRTPLSTLVGNVELLLDLDLPAHAQRSLASILRAGERLTELAGAVTQLVELDAAAAPLERIPTDLGLLVAEVVGVLRARALDRGVHLAVEVPRRDVGALVDPVRTRQAVMALVKNAVENAPDRTTVTVELSGDRRRLDLCVLDECEGIAPDDALGRSAPYLEATHAADPSHGRGLALTVAEAVAQAHGGELVLTGNTPAGLCARMTLPRDGMRLVG